jgi:benzoate/toluate 1,2-dioxygenase beta subunit
MHEIFDMRPVSDLLFLEASLLDDRHYDDWLELYAEELEYWVPIRPGQTSPHNEVSIFYEDRAALEFRVKRLLHPDIHVQIPPSRTCRQITNIRMISSQQDGTTLECQSKLVMHEYRPPLTQQCFAATCHHTLQNRNGSLRIRRKKVELINSDAALSPLSFPF